MEHWRRWHISLSTWLKDYLYIPLGGSRAGPARTDLALATTFLLGGVWHGAGWRFVLWGLYNGLLLVAWRRWGPRDGGGRLRRLGLMALTFHAICLGLVFLHVEDLDGAGAAFGAFGRLTLPTSAAPWGLAALAVAVGLHATPTAWRERGLGAFAAMPGWGQAAAVGMVGAVLALFGELSAPFFYFQF
jgi:D-alanyl-lipoteichoic acid acyltransferase DltB (MBOAT superfamily)